MSFLETILRLAARNLRAHLRYFLTGILTISAGQCGLTLFQLYISDAVKVVRTVFEDRFMLADITIETDGELMNEQTQAKIIAILSDHSPQVETVAPVLNVVGVVRTKAASTVFFGKGIDPERAAAIRGRQWEWDAVAGKPLQKGNMQDEIVIGNRMGRILGCRFDAAYENELSGSGYLPRERPFECPARTIQLSASTTNGQINVASATVVGFVDGVFQELDSRIIYMPLGLAQNLMQTNAISSFSVRTKSGIDSGALIRQIRQSADAAGLGVRVRSWKDTPDGEIYRRVYDVFVIFRGFIVSILVVIASLSVFYSFQKSTGERSQEIGTLRSLGFRSSQITGLFLAESVLMAIVAALIGSGGGILIKKLINQAQIQYQVGGLNRTVPFTLADDPSVFVATAMVMTVVAVLAALVAVQGRLKNSAADNLRSV